MRSAINNVERDASTNGETATAVDVETQFETAALPLKGHLSGWGAPFADIEDAAVREMVAIMGEHWRRGTPLDA